MALEFYLNDELVSLASPQADETVLDFLREKKRLKGTKEGCAEGDCGACTVLIGKVKNGKLSYQAMNACIAFLPMLHRAHLVTIEALGEDDKLHPIQQSMTDFHATQCGFCTPGIVMSLYAAWMNSDEGVLSFADYQKAMQGNLCRCTGYASIARAVEALTSKPGQDVLVKEQQKWQEKLEALDASLLEIKGEKPFVIPQNLSQLEQASSQYPNAIYVAGATDIGLWINKQFRDISPAIFLHQVKELETIEISDNEIRIGAMVSYDQAEKALASALPALQEFWPRIAGQQVRNMGTLGGNIANGSPIGDTPPVWIALGGRIVLNQGGKRRELPLEDFFIDYGKQDRAKGEFLESIILPRDDLDLKVFKISKRPDEDISSVLCAIAMKRDQDKILNIRIAFGGMAAIPKRAPHAEAALCDLGLGEEGIRAAMKALTEDFSPISDMRASKDYRLKTAQNCLLRAFDEWQTEELV